MSWFANISFERKLRLSMLITTTAALLLACSLFLVFQHFGDRRSLEQTARTLGYIAGENSTAAIAFEDPDAAAETLEALRAEPQILSAAIYGLDGNLFASYTTADGRPVPGWLPPGPDELVFERDFIATRQRIIEGERHLGTIYLVASTAQLAQKARKLALVMVLVLLGTIALISVFAFWLQRTLSRPILELANTVGAITARQDWSLRAHRYGDDELGKLTDDFNTMLARTEGAVAALRKNEAQLRLVTDNAPVLLARLDREFRFKFINRPHAEAFAKTPEEIIGLTKRALLGEATYREVLPHMRAAIRGERVDFELAFVTREMGKRWFEVSYVPEPEDGGLPGGFLAVMTDITERKATEEEVARARDQALAASRAKDDFLAALSHELRTPLSPVLLISSERAEQDALDPTIRSDFTTIRHNVELEARLIDDLLDLTRITRGKLALQRRPIDLQTALDNALAAARSDLGDKQLSISTNFKASNSNVKGDAVRLQQVFWNILKNAVKFTPEGGEISISSRDHTDRGTVEIVVRDSGIGMTPSELGRVFEAFTQGDHFGRSGSHIFGGLGLGLAIARMLVELHEGRIEATSPGRGKGTTVSVELPVIRQTVSRVTLPQEEEGFSAQSRRIRATEPVVAGNRVTAGEAASVRILLVEDHAPTRASLLALLNVRGYYVEGASCFSEAVKIACEADPPFEVLISDIGLPDGDGCSLMRTLRKRFPDLKAVALSGYGMDEDIERSHAAGFSAHLIKPITVRDLDEALPALIHQS